MTTSKGRIAQTYPDINSSGSTIATSAGVRSLPEPFISLATGVEVLIQNGVVNIPLLSLSASAVLGTSVDVARSFIQYRGCNVLATSTCVTTWRNRINFTSIVGGFSSTVTARRNLSTDAAVDVYFTVVTFTGANTDSADIRIENCDFPTVTAPNTSGTCVLAGPQLTTAELARAIVFVRGIEFIQNTGPSGAGTKPGEHIEQCHGTLNLVNSGGNTELRYSRFTPGSLAGPDDCGNSDVDVYATVVIFP